MVYDSFSSGHSVGNQVGTLLRSLNHLFKGKGSLNQEEFLQGLNEALVGKANEIGSSVKRVD